MKGERKQVMHNTMPKYIQSFNENERNVKLLVYLLGLPEKLKGSRWSDPCENCSELPVCMWQL